MTSCPASERTGLLHDPFGSLYPSFVGEPRGFRDHFFDQEDIP